MEPIAISILLWFLFLFQEERAETNVLRNDYTEFQEERVETNVHEMITPSTSNSIFFRSRRGETDCHVVRRVVELWQQSFLFHSPLRLVRHGRQFAVKVIEHRLLQVLW
jgi:predicted SpoU family rRNA methylase